MDRIIKKLETQGYIPSKELPADLMKFYGECSAKEISLDIWNKIAISLYENGESEKFTNIMHYIQTIEMDKPIHETPSGKTFKRYINNTTIQVLLAKASKEENVDSRNGYFQQAIQTLNTSRIKDVKSQNYSISGFINFYQNKQIGLTLKNLQNACVSEKSDIIDILGQGQVCFYAKDYAKALEFFKEALQKNPKLPGRARLGLAYCFYMLKKFELAKRAFQRVIDLDPTVYEAYLGLAILASQRCELNEYVKYLNKAYEINKENPLVLFYITEFYYLQGDFEKVKKIAFKALNNQKLMPKILLEADKLKQYQKSTRTDFYDIKSNLYSMIASCFHHEKKYDLAQKFYDSAFACNRGNLQAGYGLAQIYIHNQHYDQAYKRLDEIKSSCPENEKEITFELFKPLAYLLSKLSAGQNKQLQQQEYYNKALQFFPKDFEAQLEYANNLTDVEPNESLHYFKLALGVLQEKKERINPEIYNNIGVLEMHLFNYPKAKEAFQTALNIANPNDEESIKYFTKQSFNSTSEDDESELNRQEAQTKRKSFICTVKFNLGIMMEGLHNLEEATQYYLDVLNQCTYYLDAYVRLAHIEYRRGNYQNALKYCDEAIEKKEEAKTSNVRSDLVSCMKGYIQNNFGDDISAKESFYQIKKSGINDNYSKLFMYFMDYEALVQKRGENSEFSKKMMIIGEKIKDLLSSDTNNIQAMMVLGVVIAENGQIAEAKEIFNVLKENIGVFPNIAFNIGQIQFLEKNFSEALTSYKKYQEREKEADDEYVRTQIALCYLHLDKFKEAKNTLKKLILRYPESLTHRYNFFITQQIEVEKVFSDDTRTLKEKEVAFAVCKKAKEFFDFLKNDQKCKKTRYQDHFCAQVKQKRMEYYNTMMEKGDTKRLMLDTNIRSFEKMLHDARNKQQSSTDKANHFNDVIKRWQIDQELKRIRLEEDKKQEDLKEQEKRNERARKIEEIQKILEKQNREAEQDKEKRKKREDGGGRKKRHKKNTGGEEDDYDQIDDDLLGLDALNISDDDQSFNQQDQEIDQIFNQIDNEEEYDANNNNLNSKRHHKSSTSKYAEGEQPAKKKKKVLKRSNKRDQDASGSVSAPQDEENDIDNLFEDDPLFDQKNKIQEEEEEVKQVPQASEGAENQTKKPKRKAIVDDDDPDDIFQD